MQVTIKKLEKSEVEISGELPAKDFEVYRKEAVKKIGANIKVPGFRKGHVPENILTKKVPEISFLEEMAEQALREVYPKILKEHKIDAIGQPEITITKLAKGNPLGFKIKTTIMPEVELPDYRKIAKEASGPKEDIAVTDEEVEKMILEIRKMKTKSQKHESTKTRKQNQASSLKTKDYGLKTDSEELPELNDEFVKTLGDFSCVADFKTKLKENIKLEKEIKARDKRRIKMIEGITQKSKVDIPQIFINTELDKMIRQLQSDISTSGFTFDDYLKHLNKTEADLRKAWEKDAEKRVKFQFIISKISVEENIKVDEKDIEDELSLLMETHKGADPQRARALVEHTLVNEKVLQLLED